jgi:hypothetical protein
MENHPSELAIADPGLPRGLAVDAHSEGSALPLPLLAIKHAMLGRTATIHDDHSLLLGDREGIHTRAQGIRAGRSGSLLRTQKILPGSPREQLTG